MPRSTLTRFAPLMREPDPTHARAAASKAWHDHGILVADPERYRDSWGTRQQIINLGNELYGKRRP